MPSAVATFRLLLLCSGRSSEIQLLRWEGVKVYCVELPDAKTRGRVVPLGPEGRTVLTNLPREDDNPWVIVGRLLGSHITNLRKPWLRIRARRAGERANSRPSSCACFPGTAPGQASRSSGTCPVARRRRRPHGMRTLPCPRFDPTPHSMHHRKHRCLCFHLGLGFSPM